MTIPTQLMDQPCSIIWSAKDGLFRFTIRMRDANGAPTITHRFACTPSVWNDIWVGAGDAQADHDDCLARTETPIALVSVRRDPAQS